MATSSKESAAKNKGGRPSKFDPKFVKQVYQLALLGLTEDEMAKVIGVTRSTFSLWKTTQDGFSDAITRGKVIADGEVAASLRERAIGYSHPEVVITSYQGVITKTRVTRHYPPDTNAASIWLRNRQPARWKVKPDPADGSDEAPPPVKVTVNVVDARRPSSDADAQSAAG